MPQLNKYIGRTINQESLGICIPFSIANPLQLAPPSFSIQQPEGWVEQKLVHIKVTHIPFNSELIGHTIWHLWITPRHDNGPVTHCFVDGYLKAAFPEQTSLWKLAINLILWKIKDFLCLT